MKLFRSLFWSGCTAGLLMLGASAWAQSYVYPAEGQSPEQQQQDEAECHTWAVQQTGFDPANPPATGGSASAPETGPQGDLVRGAARGAAGGAVAGAITGDAGEGAAAGAAVGALFGAFNKRDRQRNQAAAQQQQQQQAAQQESAMRNEYSKARAVCLQGRGYTVN